MSLIRRAAVVAAAAALVALAVVVAVASDAGAAEPSAPGLALKPEGGKAGAGDRPAPGPAVRREVGKPVAATHFNGDVRHIPRGNVVPSEERPEPRSPHDAPPAAMAGDTAVQGSAAVAASPSPTSSFDGLDHTGW